MRRKYEDLRFNKSVFTLIDACVCVLTFFPVVMEMVEALRVYDSITSTITQALCMCGLQGFFC